jgi:hypothetical protein
MCGNFNVCHSAWDPGGPSENVHADHLMAAAESLGLTFSTLVEAGRMHFPYNKALMATIIDLMFIPTEVSLTVEHSILADMRGMSDHTPLMVVLPGPGSEVPVTRWSIIAGSDEESAYRGEVLDALEPLLAWEGQSIGDLDDVVLVIALIFTKAWGSHAKESRWGKHSNGWWTLECADAITVYWASRDQDDWHDYRCTMRAAKRDFFEECIHEVATTNQHVWDLMTWTRKCNLPLYEAISYRGVLCNSLEVLWEALDGSYNPAAACPVDLTFLDPVMPLPLWQWVPFSSLELSEALAACAKNSVPGPDHVLWAHLKFWCHSSRVTLLVTHIANVCLSLGHWPSHFKESLLVIILKPGKPSYSTPKLFRPIVLLNTLGKLIEKMLACRLQFNGIAHGAFEPNQFGGIAQHSTEDAGVYLTHLVRAGWAKSLQTSVVAFDITQFFPSLNHDVLLEIISQLGFPVKMGPFFRSYLVGRHTTYCWDAFTSDPFVADVGVGQGSALSPILSVLYLTLITRLFHASDIGQRVSLMFYVDDSTIIAQSPWVEDNLAPLKEVYGWLFRAFTALGLVLEHDKFFYLFLNQQFIMQCSITVRGKQYKWEYCLWVYTCKIVREAAALTSPFRAVKSLARVKRGQENDQENWALRCLPKPALVPDMDHPQHAQSTPKNVPSQSWTHV